MPNDFEALIGELEEAGLDESYIDRLKSATAASPIRKERDQFKADLATALAQRDQFRSKALVASFKDLGIKVSPTALRMPDDLDVTDDAALRTWAEGAGLVDPPPVTTASPAEQQAHQQAAAAANGAGVNTAQPTTADVIANANTPEEVMAALVAAGHPTSFDQ